MAECLFCQIAEGLVPSENVHEDDEVLAFHDINPNAPIHLLVIPKEHIANFESLVAHPMLPKLVKVANDLGKKHSPELGHRVMVNSEKQADISHVHLHVLGGLQPAEGLRQGGDRT